MSIFQSFLDAVSNPNQAGTQKDLQGLAGLAALVPGLAGAEHQLPPILDVLGSHLKDALSQQQQTQGTSAAQQTVTTLSQGGVSVPQLQSLFGQDRFQQIIADLTQRTGLNEATLLGMLPVVLPVVMRVLSAGTQQANPQAPNPVLSQFLSGNQSGGSVLSEAFQLASQFLRR
ncbi:MAG TPA: hypothetical protein VGD78_09390 [Chthoniobacterales bacterium]